MRIAFPFKEEKSPLFGKIYRPIANISIKHKTREIWQPVTMLIDTGADYTLLPRFLAKPLGVSLKTDCKKVITQGVGGRSVVFLVKGRMGVRIGGFARTIPLGFFESDYVPPLLGRLEFFETLRVVFDKFITTFEE